MESKLQNSPYKRTDSQLLSSKLQVKTRESMTTTGDFSFKRLFWSFRRKNSSRARFPTQILTVMKG